jgi:hypothetical protein
MSCTIAFFIPALTSEPASVRITAHPVSASIIE